MCTAVIESNLLSSSNTQLRHWGIYFSVSSNHANDAIVTWLLPLLRVLKVNFDVSISGTKIAIGFIIRDHNGVLLRVGANFCYPLWYPILSCLSFGLVSALL